MSAENIEQRVAALEAEVARLKEQAGKSPNEPWWKNMVGAFLNDPYFEKAMKIGRKYRESTRPKGKKKRKKKDADS